MLSLHAESLNCEQMTHDFKFGFSRIWVGRACDLWRVCPSHRCTALQLAAHKLLSAYRGANRMKLGYGCLLALLAIRLGSATELGPFTVSFSPSLSLKVHDTQSGALLFSNSQDAVFHTVQQSFDITQSQGGVFVIKTNVTDICPAPLQPASIQSVGANAEFPMGALVASAVMCHGSNLKVTLHPVAVADPFSKEDLIALQMDAVIQDGPYAAFAVAFDLPPGAGVFGLGEQYTYFNQRGHKFNVLSAEQGVGRGQQPTTDVMNLLDEGSAGDAYTTYTSIPQWVTSQQQGLYTTNTELAAVDFTGATSGNMTVNSTSLSIRVTQGSSVQEHVRAYTAYTGRMAPLPQWVDGGAVVGLQGGDAAVRGNISFFLDFVAQGLDTPYPPSGNSTTPPLAGAWMQDWSGQHVFVPPQAPRVGLWWNWQYDRVEYAQWPQTVDWLRQRGLKTLSYANSMLKNVSDRVPQHYPRNLYQEAYDLGYLVYVPDEHTGEPVLFDGYGAGLVDLFNPDAASWFEDILVSQMLAPQEGGAVSGWMADFAEALPFNAVRRNGSAIGGQALHSAYATKWAETNARAVAKAGLTGEIAFFSRSASQLGPGFSTLYWMGDQTSTWDVHDGLRSTMVAMLSSGLSGFALTHSDVGGYTTLDFAPLLNVTRSVELQLRWSEMGAFYSMFRSHLGSQPSHDVQSYSSNKTAAVYLQSARLFRALAPVRRALMAEHQRTGAPLARPMFWEFGACRQTWEQAETLKTQFTLGSDLLVAPVTIPDTQVGTVWLPPGSSWVHVWSGTVYEGGQAGVNATVPAPFGQPPLFYREDTTTGKATGLALVSRLVSEGLLNPQTAHGGPRG